MKMDMQVAWTQTYADAYAFNNGDMADAFLETVMRPSMRALHERLVALKENPDPNISELAVYDHSQLMTHANMSFCLAIHSLWERQIRTYLIGTVRHLRMVNPSEKKIQKADWEGLVKIFRSVKGLRLDSFDSYARLDILQLLGNTCRHGDGKSAETLFEKCPELWPEASKPFWFGSVPPVLFLQIPDAFISKLVDAIVLFWIDMRILSFESLVSQIPSLAEQLEVLKSERAARL